MSPLVVIDNPLDDVIVDPFMFISSTSSCVKVPNLVKPVACVTVLCNSVSESFLTPFIW